jgi:hypothetical protein
MPPRELFATQFAECIAELRNLCNDTADDAVTPRGKTRALLRILQRMSECQVRCLFASNVASSFQNMTSFLF